MAFKKTMLFLCLFLQSMTFRGQAEGCLHKLNNAPVCFGARDNQFGRFYAEAGNLAAITLVHLYGYVSCDVNVKSHWSYWGCGITRSDLRDHVNIAITTSSNTMIFPPTQFIEGGTKWSKIPGYNSMSPELLLTVLSDPYKLTSGQELLLKYGEDMMDQSEADNGGKVCCDVYALYV